MAEWLKAHAWKACVRETVPWVRIPLSPPEYSPKSLQSPRVFLSARDGAAQISPGACKNSGRIRDPSTLEAASFGLFRKRDPILGKAEPSRLIARLAHFLRDIPAGLGFAAVPLGFAAAAL
jgi:hypothetical protein